MDEQTKHTEIAGTPFVVPAGQQVTQSLEKARLLIDHVQATMWDGMRAAAGEDVSFGYDQVVAMDFLLDIVKGLYSAVGAEA